MKKIYEKCKVDILYFNEDCLLGSGEDSIISRETTALDPYGALE